MKKQTSLGKGMSALLNNKKSTLPSSLSTMSKEKTVRMPSNFLMDINLIDTNPNQPRKIFSEKELGELQQSIVENGIIQPLVVTPTDGETFLLIAGERRYRAARKAGLKQVPVVIKKGTKRDSAIISIIENVQRSDLNCIEEALAYYHLMDEYGLTQEMVAKKIGKTRSSVANFLRLLKLPKETIIQLKESKLSFGHGKILASLKDDLLIMNLAERIIAESLSVRELERIIKGGDKKPTAKKTTQASSSMDSIKNKLEQMTGFHFGIKMSQKGSGEVKLKFNNESELNDIIEYFYEK